MNSMSTITSAVPLQEIAEFVWNEAELLDRKDYDAWLALWAGEGHYIMPINPDGNYEDELNLCYDDAKMRKMRIERFQAGFSISSAPPAQTIRTVSRFVIEAQDGETVTLRCAQHLIEDKFGRQRVFGANLRYVLLRTENGLRIRDKVATLLNSDGELTALSYLF